MLVSAQGSLGAGGPVSLASGCAELPRSQGRPPARTNGSCPAPSLGGCFALSPFFMDCIWEIPFRRTAAQQSWREHGPGAAPGLHPEGVGRVDETAGVPVRWQQRQLGRTPGYSRRLPPSHCLGGWHEGFRRRVSLPPAGVICSPCPRCLLHTVCGVTRQSIPAFTDGDLPTH